MSRAAVLSTTVLTALVLLSFDPSGSAQAQETKNSWSAPASVSTAWSLAKKSSPKSETLEKLLAGLQKSRGLSAKYRERRYITLLAAPLRSRGQVYFVPADRLARHTSTPEPSRVLLSGNKLTISDRGGTRHMDVSKHPALAAFVRSFASLLRGDRDELARTFTLRFHRRSKGKWKLTLVPKSKAVRKMVKSLKFYGRGLAVSKMILREPNGDRTVTHFSAVQTDRKFTAKERKEFFAPLEG